MEWIIQLVGPFVLCALAWPFVQWRRRVNRREAVAIAQFGQRALGLVKEVWRDGDGWNVTYEFVPGIGRAPVERTESLEEVTYQPANVGEQIEVAYEPRSPYHSRIVFAQKVQSAV